MPGQHDMPRRLPGQPRVRNARNAVPPKKMPQVLIDQNWPAPQGDEDPRVRKAAWIAEDENNGPENRGQRIARNPNL